MIPTLAKTLSKITFLPCTYHLDTEAEMKGHLRLKPLEASPPCRPHAMQIPRAGPLVLGAADRTMGHGRKSCCSNSSPNGPTLIHSRGRPSRPDGWAGVGAELVR